MDWKAFWNESPQVRDADFCRQVGRTFRRAAYSERQLEVLVERILFHLSPSSTCTLLDVACGNGLITNRLAPYFTTITAVDFSEPLIETARTHFGRQNIHYLVGDAVELKDVRDRYDRVLVSAALQHFSPAQAARLFQRLKDIVAPGGRIVLGDVADGDRIWNFHSGVAGRCQYALDRLRGRRIIGHWWSPSAIERLAADLGWRMTVHYQPAELPNHYFRYDVVLEVA
jgi:2-polyprenyl-3-methyl-5-hydroxy-6-metoxy-1,4-benzoquinol methylase